MKKIMNANISMEEIELLELIASRKGTIYGRNLLKEVIYRNTHRPDFEVGDIVIFCNYDRRIYGYQLIDMVGRIVEANIISDIDKNKNRTYCSLYKIEFEIQVEDKGLIKEIAYVNDNFKYSTIRKANCEYHINNVGKAKDEHSDCISL